MNKKKKRGEISIQKIRNCIPYPLVGSLVHIPNSLVPFSIALKNEISLITRINHEKIRVVRVKFDEIGEKK